MCLFPVEIKLSKTPKLTMAGNIRRFKRLFPGLNIKEGQILSVSDKNIMLGEDIKVIRLDDYLEGLRNI